jgi:hypothetical protein
MRPSNGSVMNRVPVFSSIVIELGRLRQSTTTVGTSSGV